MEDSIYILSFDIGIKNMSYCLLEYLSNQKPKILEWKVKNLQCHKKNSEKLIDHLIEFLDEMYKNDLNNRYPLIVLIENQMTSVMRALQVAIKTYFKVKSTDYRQNIQTKYISAKLKMNLINRFINNEDVSYTYPEFLNEITSSYKRNKLLSCDFTQWYLCNILDDNEDIERILEKEKKWEPDMSDCFLQAISFIEKCVI